MYYTLSFLDFSLLVYLPTDSPIREEILGESVMFTVLFSASTNKAWIIVKFNKYLWNKEIILSLVSNADIPNDSLCI